MPVNGFADGTLRIFTTPEDAEVYVDSELKSINTPVSIKLPDGKYHIEVRQKEKTQAMDVLITNGTILKEFDFEAVEDIGKTRTSSKEKVTGQDIRDILLQPRSTVVETTPPAITELEIDFRNRKEGVIKAESFKEKGIMFKINGNTQSCGEAVLEVQHHKLLGNYLAPTPVGERGLSCAQLQIDISFARPVAEVSVLTHAELGTMKLSAYNKDGNSIGRRLSTEFPGENTKRLTFGSPSGDASIFIGPIFMGVIRSCTA